MHGVAVTVDDQGRIARVEADGASGGRRIRGTVVPAMSNLHGHAFQRAFAGRAERRGPDPRDSFWTWREQMYGAARSVEPATLRGTAAALYRDLRAAGFSTVVEFHYLHHRPDGRPYDDRLAMARALVAAADEAGVRLCLLPVLYQRAGFFSEEPRPEMARFVLSTEAYLEMLNQLQASLQATPHRVGIAFHSLRAVGLEAMERVLEHRASWDPEAPVHIHVAEQPLEVEECRRAHGARPVELLTSRFDVGDRWCLVHATHAEPDELRGLAPRGAVVGLCPITEANLGDGLFDLDSFLVAGGRFGVGTDAHVASSPFEELRWLEYGQRLRTGRRNVVDQPTPHVGTNLWLRALDGGARAAGVSVGRIEPGYFADWLVYDDPQLSALPVEERLDALIFAPWAPAPVTWVGGRPPGVTGD